MKPGNDWKILHWSMAFCPVPWWIPVYRMSQKEMSVFWEVIVSLILSKSVYAHVAQLRQECHNWKCVTFQERLLKILKCYNFLWVQRRHNCSPAASFANCVMTSYLLKVHLQTFLSIPINQKCQILNGDTLVANERHVQYMYNFCLEWPILWPPRILTFPPWTPCVRSTEWWRQEKQASGATTFGWSRSHVSRMDGTDSLLCSAGHRQSRALCSVCWTKSVLSSNMLYANMSM